MILLIGDGMGYNHIENAKTYFGLDEQVFEKQQASDVITLSASGTTDSAAAATALATGTTVINGRIGEDITGDDLTSISELAKAAELKVGIVTTDLLSGATPAGFSAHAYNRGDTDDIAQTQSVSNIDLFMGDASDSFHYYNNYNEQFTSNGYTFALSPEEMTEKAESEKLVVTLPEIRSEYGENRENHYQLKDMASFALDFLENENGFFLMIEGAHIDKYSHSNDVVNALCETRSFFDAINVVNALCETRSFFDAINVVYEWAENRNDTAILVTADHETGFLKKADDASEISDDLYRSTGHSFLNVPLYVKHFTVMKDSSPLQNTSVFEICKELLKL